MRCRSALYSRTLASMLRDLSGEKLRASISIRLICSHTLHVTKEAAYGWHCQTLLMSDTHMTFLLGSQHKRVLEDYRYPAPCMNA